MKHDEIIATFRSNDDAAVVVAVYRFLTELTYAGVNEKWDHIHMVEAWLNHHDMFLPGDE